MYPQQKGTTEAEYKRVNVCVPHVNTIGEWLNLSIRPMMKLPRTSLDPSKQTHLTPYFNSE